MRILGFDPSLTNFGWAMHDPGASGSCRCPDRGRFQTSARQLFIERYIEMRSKVTDLVRRLEISRVGVEYPIFNDLWSEGMYGLFLYTCEALYASQVDVVFFSPLQVKTHARDFLGRPKGWKMMKPDMVEAARTDTGGKGRWNHNEADAYWVARTASRFWGLVDEDLQVEDLSPNERKQFLSIHQYRRGKKAGKTEYRGLLYREDERFFRWSGGHNGPEEKG